MNFTRTLSRNEMKHIKGGGGAFPCVEGWDSCTCYTQQGGQKLGTSCCTGLTTIECCQVPFPGANYGECELAPAG